ncbi:Rieske (2Fe-2S) protein [Mucilaginibacter sp.]|uniref:Rieske (2Fe-2S) protein n=1 Tax=Mucilaginibacter sp. TaxID=1882438 RepID=UPI0035638F9B
MILALVGMLFFSCGKTGDVVPNVPVNLRITKTDPNAAALNAIGGSIIISGQGVAGIIIYRGINGYVAYDRCSSYQPEKQCAVTVDDTGFTVTDPCSGAKFSLTDGSPVKAPATRSLKTYNVNTTQFEIIVYN